MTWRRERRVVVASDADGHRLWHAEITQMFGAERMGRIEREAALDLMAAAPALRAMVAQFAADWDSWSDEMLRKRLKSRNPEMRKEAEMVIAARKLLVEVPDVKETNDAV